MSPAFSSAGQSILKVDGFERKSAKSALRHLPLSDRFKLFARLAHESLLAPARQNDPSWQEALNFLSSSFDFGAIETVAQAFQTAMEGKPFRRYSIPSLEDHSESDGFQTGEERDYQKWLAQTLLYILPNATHIGPDVFFKTRLTPEQQGTAFALLSLPCRHTSEVVHGARQLVEQNIHFTPKSWIAFTETCHQIATQPALCYSLPNALPPSCQLVEHLLDDLNRREIDYRLKPQNLRDLDDATLTSYMAAITGSRICGNATPAFEATRRSFYANMNPPKALSALRQRQIDRLIHTTQSQDEAFFEGFRASKKNWHNMQSHEKKEALLGLHELICIHLEIPLPPRLLVCKISDYPKKKSSPPNGFFNAWKNQDGTPVWENTVVLLDGHTPAGTPLSCQKSMRAAAGTLGHEDAHSCLDQLVYQLRSSIFHEAYLSLFPEGCAPSALKNDNPLYPTAHLLHLFESETPRTSYIPASDDFSLYRNQPKEKFVSQYQNPVVAALNGTLVLRQIERGERDIPQELNEIFEKVGQTLTSRLELIGRDGDLYPLQRYEPLDHPFRGLLMRKGDPVDSAGDLFSSRVLDLSNFGDKREILAHLKRRNPFKGKKPFAIDDKKTLSFFQSSADFLAEMPPELRALKTFLNKDEKDLALKFDNLMHRCQELAEDLYDYAYVATRTQTRKTSVAKLRAHL